MSKLRIEGEALASVMSNCGSPMSSWMSDLSMGSEADQSLHSFSQSQSHQGEALADVDGVGTYESCGSPRRGSVDGEAATDKRTPTKDRLRKLPPSMAKTNIQILSAPGKLSAFKSTVNVQSCGGVKPMIIQKPTILSSPKKTSSIKDTVTLASISSEMSFEDPWLKRSRDEGRSRELESEVKQEKREAEHLKTNPGEKAETPSANHRSFCRDGKRCFKKYLASKNVSVLFLI